LVEARDNVFMSRTFSKIYGLGGLRIGWGYGPQEIVDVLQRIRGPFNLSAAALAAAEVAVRDVTHTQKCRDDFLKTQGIIVRRVAGYNLPECLRITVGDESGCRRVVHAIGQFKAAAS